MIVLYDKVLGASFLDHYVHCVPKKVTPKYKSQQLRQILSELNVLSAALIIAFLAQTLQISTKSIAQFMSNSRLKNGTQKQKFPIWKIPIRLLTARSVASNDVMSFTFLWRVWLT